MPEYRFIVTVVTATEEQAGRVMAERLGHDEDYGFGYAVEYAEAAPSVSDGVYGPATIRALAGYDIPELVGEDDPEWTVERYNAWVENAPCVHCGLTVAPAGDRRCPVTGGEHRRRGTPPNPATLNRLITEVFG